VNVSKREWWKRNFIWVVCVVHRLEEDWDSRARTGLTKHAMQLLIDLHTDTCVHASTGSNSRKDCRESRQCCWDEAHHWKLTSAAWLQQWCIVHRSWCWVRPLVRDVDCVQKNEAVNAASVIECCSKSWAWRGFCALHNVRSAVVTLQINEIECKISESWALHRPVN
jgi:hypothetical protein